MAVQRSKWKTVVFWIRKVMHRITKDRITVYAAQASFFVVISTVPFLSMLISIFSFFLPADARDIFSHYAIPENLMPVLGTLLEDLQDMPNVSLLSLSAITVLWAASRGTAAIHTGIETVYRARRARNFLVHRIKSFLNTLAFLALILAVVALMLFGHLVDQWLSFIPIMEIVMKLRIPFFMLFMCVVFAIMYRSTARRSGCVKTQLRAHFPGAAFASVGWMLFSYFYSLYIQYFPRASYIYGGLTAVCLMMLWLYFCMMILLLGAEINKVYPAFTKRWKNPSPTEKEQK